MEFESFYRQHYDRSRRVMSLALGDVGLAEECLQEAFLKAFKQWRKVSVMDRPDGWIYTVAMNEARDQLRRGRRQPGPAPSVLVESFESGACARLDVLRRLEALTDRQRQAVTLRFLGDLTVREVATAMGCADGTVKATLHTALGQLCVTGSEV